MPGASGCTLRATAGGRGNAGCWRAEHCAIPMEPTRPGGWHGPRFACRLMVGLTVLDFEQTANKCVRLD